MTTEAFVGNIFLYRGNGASPEVFSKVCQVFDIGGLGVENALVEATTFCSGGSREYIGGLADGAEITLELNYEQSAAVITDMEDDVTDKATRNFQIRIEDGSPTRRYSFAAICLKWMLNPNVADRNTFSYTMKITGAITRTN
jgi:hypothetical protein